jgi:hypothetical protein
VACTWAFSLKPLGPRHRISGKQGRGQLCHCSVASPLQEPCPGSGKPAKFSMTLIALLTTAASCFPTQGCSSLRPGGAVSAWPLSPPPKTDRNLAGQRLKEKPALHKLGDASFPAAYFMVIQ